jgi:fatty-acyl-CoA synthase
MRITDHIQDHAVKRPDDDAVIEAGLRMNWHEFNCDVHARARALRMRGIERGSRVALELPNGREFLATMVATWLLEAIVVPINLRWSEREKAAVLRDSAANIVVRPGMLKPEPGPIHLRAVDPSSVAAIYYTSGSSGQPKGAVHTHASIEANARQFIEALELTRHDVNYGAAPFFHVAGLAVFTIPMLMTGGSTVCARTFDPSRAIAELDAYGATVACMVPQMWRRIANNIHFDEAEFALRVGVSGGAPTPQILIDRFAGRGIPLVRGYGMTEAGPMATLQRPGCTSRDERDCGTPGSEVEVRVVDAERRPVGYGVAGEIAVRGPNVMARYWKRPTETAAALDADGWYYTRDQGVLRDGRLVVLGRLDDMIITGGENVFPAEVEAFLQNVPAIADVAVVGVPNDEWGEEVTAVVVAAPGHTVTESTLVSALVGNVARYKIPRTLHVVEELPTGPTGKIDRARLRDALSKQTVNASGVQ